MQKMKKLLNLIFPGLQKFMTYHSIKHDTAKNKILQSDIYKNLDQLEKKMILNESQIYQLRQFIESKSSESDFSDKLQDAMNIVSKLNHEIVKKTLETW